jgi:uncharacterized Tic20 family protein
MNAYPPSPYKTAGERPDRTGDNWAMLCHLAGFAGFFFPLVANIVVPLLIWIFKRDEYDAVAYHGKEAINFQISMSVYMLIAGMSFFVFIGFFLVPLVGIFWIVLTIIASLKAADGQPYRYPLIFRLI